MKNGEMKEKVQADVQGQKKMNEGDVEGLKMNEASRFPGLGQRMCH